MQSRRIRKLILQRSDAIVPSLFLSFCSLMEMWVQRMRIDSVFLTPVWQTNDWKSLSVSLSSPLILATISSMLAMLHIWLGCFSDPHVNFWLGWCDNGENIWHCLICKKNHWNSGYPESLTWGCLLDPHIEFCSDSLTMEKKSLQYAICKKNRRTSGNLKSLARGCLLDPHIKLCSETMEKTYCIVFYARIASRFGQPRELDMRILVRSSYQSCSDGLTMWKTLLHCLIS